MKKVVVITLLSIFSLSFSLAQEEIENYSRELDQVKVVVLELTGTTEIISADRDENFSMKSTLFKKGEVIGWHFPEERPVFQQKESLSGDTLFLSSPKRHQPKVIGITTYAESIQNIIFCPTHVQLIVNSADKLSINGDFEKLRTRNVDQLDMGTIEKSSVKSFKVSGSRASIAGMKRAPNFEIIGYGTQEYDLRAKELNIHAIR